uniref:Uncharacterized protein n=1 Tax=Globisporangium ultimum (strain ATCC 200006 / CBS 805.95 / DAOM BR144) TaxID=431595 RepID=K3WFY8_GLOUD
MAGGPTRSASGAPWAVGARTRVIATSTYTSSSVSLKAREQEEDDEALRGGSVLHEVSSAAAKEYEADYDGGDDVVEEEDDGDDGWENVGDDAPVFRDASFLDDDADSEYAPSDHEERDGEKEWSDDELSPTELVDEEEETTIAGLFANVVRQFGGGKKAKRVNQRPGNAPNDNDDAFFDEQDAMYWGNETEKQQWIERYEAANKQFVHRYGCRIDSPAHPDAKARLRREKKKTSVYSLILFALTAAYLVQLVVMSAPLPSALLPLSYIMSVSQTLSRYANQLPRSSDVYHSFLKEFSSSDAHSNESTEETASAKAPKKVDEHVKVDSVGAEAATDSVESQKAPVTTTEKVAIDVDVHVEATEVLESVFSPAGEQQQQQERDDVDSKSSQHEAVIAQAGDASLKREEKATPLASEIDSVESTEAAVDAISEYSKVAVQLCSKFLYKLVNTKHDQAMKEAATRACDAAVSMASRESVEWVEARVLRGDLWSLVSEFDAAEDDYSTATASPVLSRDGDTTLSDSIQLKIVSNRWIKMFVKKSYKELYHECDQAAKAEQSSVPLRSLAADWVLVFKKKKQALDVLTRSRSWTLQRLEYA